MANPLYVRIQASAQRLIEKYGQTGTVTSLTPPDPDCTTFCASWVLQATGRDVSEGLRGTYGTADEANAIVEAAGGIEGFVGSRLAPFGFKRVQQPYEGDVGIVTGLTGFDFEGATVKHIPAIYFGPCVGGLLWAVMSARGPQVKKLDFSAAWRIA